MSLPTSTAMTPPRSTQRRLRLTLKKKADSTKTRRSKHNQAMSKWQRRKKNRNQADADLEIVSSGIQKRCPLSQCVMKHPMRSTVCNHIFEREAILKYIHHQQQQTKSSVKCPEFGCQKNISLQQLVYDSLLVELIQSENNDTSKRSHAPILELDDSEDDSIQTRTDSNHTAKQQAFVLDLTDDIAPMMTNTATGDDDSDLEILSANTNTNMHATQNTEDGDDDSDVEVLNAKTNNTQQSHHETCS